MCRVCVCNHGATEKVLSSERSNTITEAQSPSDRDMIDSIVAGDISALAILVRRYDQLLFRTARSILKDDAEAQDAVQEGFLQAYGRLASFRHDAKLSTWLVRIVANIAIARMRKKAHRSELAQQHHIVDLQAQDLYAEAECPDEAIARADTRRVLEAKIDALPEAYSTVFVLRAIQDLSVEEISEALGIPKATVRSRYARARSQLRQSLTKELHDVLGEAFGFAGERCQRMVNAVTSLVARAG
jgi:RNA polymerase sigma-70 factor, ECF subfamily